MPFGAPPPADIWPDGDTRFGEAPFYRRVNTAHAWVIPRPRWLDRVGGARGVGDNLQSIDQAVAEGVPEHELAVRVADEVAGAGVDPGAVVAQHEEALTADREIQCVVGEVGVALHELLGERIVRAMAARYGAHPHVVAWQLDNEFGGGQKRCYCDVCRRAFPISAGCS